MAFSFFPSLPAAFLLTDLCGWKNWTTGAGREPTVYPHHIQKNTPASLFWAERHILSPRPPLRASVVDSRQPSKKGEIAMHHDLATDWRQHNDAENLGSRLKERTGRSRWGRHRTLCWLGRDDRGQGSDPPSWLLFFLSPTPGDRSSWSSSRSCGSSSELHFYSLQSQPFDFSPVKPTLHFCPQELFRSWICV